MSTVTDQPSEMMWWTTTSELVLGVGEAQQGGAQQGAALQVEGALAVLTGNAPGLGFPLGLGQGTQVHHGQ